MRSFDSSAQRLYASRSLVLMWSISPRSSVPSRISSSCSMNAFTHSFSSFPMTHDRIYTIFSFLSSSLSSLMRCLMRSCVSVSKNASISSDVSSNDTIFSLCASSRSIIS